MRDNCDTLTTPRPVTLSIIIPVYGVEATLDRCVESVVSQSFADFELLLVDDGSPDDCPARCDDWARRDARIVAVHQPNGGLSAARNTGIERARGTYLTFIDSDDFLGKDTLAQVMAAMGENDMVEYPAYRFYGSPRQSLLTFTPRTYEDMEAYWLEGHAYEHTYAWNKVYRRCLFDHVRFPEGVVFEDAHTLPRLLRRCRRVAVIDRGCYYYCWNGHGISATADAAAIASLLRAYMAAGWMDDRCYLHALNVQVTLYQLTQAPPLLPFRPVSIWAKDLPPMLRVKAVLLRLLGIKGVCRLCHAWRPSGPGSERKNPS